MNMDDVKWMKEAIKQAKKAESYDEALAMLMDYVDVE